MAYFCQHKIDVQCKEYATVKLVYGLYSAYQEGRPYRELCFCSKHMAEFWETIKVAVAAQLMYCAFSDPMQVESLSLDFVKKLLDKEEPTTLKYVHVNGRYRFNTKETRHADMKYSTEQITSAGFVSIGKEFFLVHDTPSTSLNCGPVEVDEANIRRLLF